MLQLEQFILNRINSDFCFRNFAVWCRRESHLSDKVQHECDVVFSCWPDRKEHLVQTWPVFVVFFVLAGSVNSSWLQRVKLHHISTRKAHLHIKHTIWLSPAHYLWASNWAICAKSSSGESQVRLLSGSYLKSRSAAAAAGAPCSGGCSGPSAGLVLSPLLIKPPFLSPHL